MNILFLSELFYPHGSGAELATWLYAKHLSEAGFNVVVVTSKFAGESDVWRDGNLTVYRLPLLNEIGSIKFSILSRFDVLLSSFFRKLLKRADVAYIPRLWYPAIPLAKAYGKPVITHLHDYIPICPLSNIYDVSKDAVCGHNSNFCQPRCIYAYEKTQGRGFTQTLTSTALNSTIGPYLGKFVKFSDAIICVSKVQRGMIIKGVPSLRDKTYVIYNPIPELSYTDMEGDDFGYFGGPNYLKGFHTLCHAMMHINNADQRVMKIHATKFLSSSKQFTKSLTRIGILPYGKLDNDEYEKLYRQIQAVIVPSIWHEPWPYVVVEALVQGRFVIASCMGGISEQVEGCKGVMLFEAGNYNKLADSMEFVAGLEREKIVDLGFQNREIFLRRFDNESSLKGFISVCEHLI
jgi:glycosyltransferase involved in cell wall biosynthesis